MSIKKATKSGQSASPTLAKISIRRGIKSAPLIILFVFLTAICLQLLIPPQNARADVVAGSSEYFIPGAAEDVYDILDDLTNFTGTGTTFTNVITMPITTPNLTVYYDHWENGYLTGAAGDETYSGYAVGNVLTFKSTAIPSNPRGTNMNACTGSTNPSGTTTACYDGMDRIFVVGGAVSIAQVFWHTGTGTVFANAWEVYPVKPWVTNYTIPVGENLYAANTTAYADFDCVYVLVEAKEDSTQVTFDNSRASAPGSTACGYPWWQDGSVTINKGKTYFRGGVNSGSTITATKPVEVQLIVGREDSSWDSRSHTLVPSGLWDKEYYSPVPTYSGTDVNIYMYNPTNSTLAVTFDDSAAGTVTCNIPALSTMSVRDSSCANRFVTAGSAVHLSAASNFFAIGEYDTGGTSYNWGFSIIPKSSLNDEYFIPWAPGTNQSSPTSNGSPVFVTPTVNGQVFYVDYSPITTPPTQEATFTLNLLQVQKVRDPDNDNTGMHIWSDFPFAATWGEDDQYADADNPYIDAGYSILPPNPDWIDVVLEVDKSANPEVITLTTGEEVEFTVDVITHAFAVDNIFIEDYLPPYFAYVAGTTTITWPSGTYTTDPTITGTASGGYTLHWGTAPNNIGDLGANQTMTLKFKAVTVTGFNATTNVNNTSATGYWGSIPLTATAQATVIAGEPGHIIVIKDAVPNAPQDFTFSLINQAKPGDPTNFTLDDDADGTYQNSINFGLRPGNYTVEETGVTGWSLQSASCVSTIGGKTPTPANIALEAGETVTCTFINIPPDFGDLPDSFLTLVASNGPRHTVFPDTDSDGLPNSIGQVSAIWLGGYIINPDYSITPGVGAIDREIDGVPTSLADGDDLAASDDEDGVLISAWYQSTGSMSLDVRCTSSSASATGWLVVWFDWGHDNSFTNDTPSFSQAVSCSNTGTSQTITVSDPRFHDRSANYYRARLFEAQPSDLTTAWYGIANNGEVEDYYWEGPTAVTVSDPVASVAGQTIVVDWQTYSEMDILGFNLYRASDPNAVPTLVYQTPAKHPGKLMGDAYQYVDLDVQAGVTYIYWLEVLLKDGTTVYMQPTSASLPSAGNKVFLPIINR